LGWREYLLHLFFKQKLLKLAAQDLRGLQFLLEVATPEQKMTGEPRTEEGEKTGERNRGRRRENRSKYLAQGSAMNANQQNDFDFQLN
jgi:hypothetical protein